MAIYWEHTRGHRPLLGVIIFSLSAATVVGAITPLYFKKFFDLLAAGDTGRAGYDAIIGVLLMIGILEIIKWAFWRISAYTNSIFQSTVIAKISSSCFRYLHRHSFSYFNNNFVGSLVKRFNWFSRAFESVLDKIIWNIIPVTINVGMIIVILAKRNIWLAVAVGVWLVIFLTVNWFFTQYKLKFDIARSEEESKATGILADTITNHANVKLFVGYHKEIDSYGAANEKVRKLRRFTWHLDGIFDAIQGFLVIVLEIGIFYLAVKLWQQNKVTVGDFILIQSYLMMIFNDIWNFGRIFRFLFSDLADAEEMTVALTTPHEIVDKRSAVGLSVGQGAIEFKQVHFYYNETRKIFEDMNIAIKPHEKVALVGPSGAGKTTIIKLLLRMHDLTSGAIMIDGQKVSDVTQESLWSAISLVPQDPILFHRSLLENIRYGKPNATDEEVVEAAKLAHCHEFIVELSEGYKTFVGERGVKLSGGERQRVAIARAILRGAPILILDEATSSLDSESETLIQDALNNLMRDKTVIVIAHRLSTIMKMDRILVVDKGKILEEGSHKQLLQRKGGLYQELWKLQAGGFMPDQPAENTLAEQLRAEPVREDKVANVLEEQKHEAAIEPGPVQPPSGSQPTL